MGKKPLRLIIVVLLHVLSVSVNFSTDTERLILYMLTLQRGNFVSSSTSIGVRSQLTILSSVMKAVDPKLHEHLGRVVWSQILFIRMAKGTMPFLSELLNYK